MNDDTVRELIRCGTDMRRLQKEFFRTKDRSVLRECKGCEKHFDELLEMVNAPTRQMSLF